MAIYIANCGIDENGNATGGTAGDQTGTEWVVKKLSGSWSYVFRHPDGQTCVLIAQLATEAAENDLIGYDQSQRLTFWTQLSASGYYPSAITTACEADCSSGVAAIVKAAGYLLGDTKLQGLSKSMYTGNEAACLTGVGFEQLTYTGSSMLQNGDILLRSGHTTTVVSGAAEPTVVEDAGTGAVYRLYNSYTGDHFFTSSVSEANADVSAGWTYEGVAWVAPTSGTKVYRLYNSYATTGTHLWTTDTNERDTLVAAGWTNEGVAFYSGGSVSVYRLYNSYDGNHHYTTDENEYQTLVAAGWTGEGVAFYASSVS